MAAFYPTSCRLIKDKVRRENHFYLVVLFAFKERNYRGFPTFGGVFFIVEAGSD